MMIMILDDPVMRSSRKCRPRRLMPDALGVLGLLTSARRVAERKASLQTMQCSAMTVVNLGKLHDGGGEIEHQKKMRRRWSSKPDACCAVGVLPLLAFMMLVQPDIHDAWSTSTNLDEGIAMPLIDHENTLCGWIMWLDQRPAPWMQRFSRERDSPEERCRCVAVHW